jgi:hypothetical protein
VLFEMRYKSFGHRKAAQTFQRFIYGFLLHKYR